MAASDSRYVVHLAYCQGEYVVSVLHNDAEAEAFWDDQVDGGERVTANDYVLDPGSDRETVLLRSYRDTEKAALELAATALYCGNFPE